ncbi:MAG TPA: DUF2911 domain-containing protein [Pyrinomonadaceae bacterium]|nr:DUF2911 domain-containing protein [Pyrinomonadaceae bacterium]
MKRNLVSYITILSVIALGSVAGFAQLRLPQASQKATLMQTVGITDITINYFRPAVKGRKVWGDWPVKVEGEATLDNQNTRPPGAPIVPYGHVWRTGANTATQFIVTDDVLINGQPLAAGNYSLHSIPGKDDWTFIFNTVAEQGGSFNYDKTKDALRVKAKPDWNAEHQESLGFTVDPSSDVAATVVLRWEKLRVPFTLEVKDPLATIIAKASKAVAAAKPDDFNTPFQAANFARDRKLTAEAAKWYEQALKVADAEIAAGDTYRANLRKFNALAALGRTSEAVPFGERAVVLGKAATPKVDTAALEKRIADLKAVKP